MTSIPTGRDRGANRAGVKRVTFTPLSPDLYCPGSCNELGTQEIGCDLAFTCHQKREPARVRLRREAQSGGWHRPHESRRYPSTPLPQGTDGLRANQSTREGDLATVGIGSTAPSAWKPRRLRRGRCHTLTLRRQRLPSVTRDRSGRFASPYSRLGRNPRRVSLRHRLQHRPVTAYGDVNSTRR